jgi:O-antigen ligase
MKASQPLAVPETGSPNMVATFGFFLYCAYVLSGFANDWAFKLLGNKAYISTVAVVLLPVPWLLSGNALRGLQRPIGRWWAAFLVLLLLATPFSVWRSGSAMMLFNYIPRNYLTFFYISAFVTSLKQCRSLMYVNVVGAVVLLLTCLKFGGASGAEDGRFAVPGSLFYANANELGLALLLGVTSFLFLVSQRGVASRILGAAGILFCVLYALKTGSRGCLLAAIAMFGMIFWFGRNKLMTAVFVLPVVAIVLLFLPSATLHRLLLFGTNPGELEAHSDEDVAAIGSQMQRQELFKKSLSLTFRHPLLGVGPDEFAVAAAGDAAKQGVHSAWLGTHNSYTQVSSECGIPAFICYCAVLALCFRTNWRLYRWSRDNPVLKDVTNLSFCLLAGTLVYAVSTFFFHIAYSGGLPTLAGFTLALQLTAEPLLASHRMHESLISAPATASSR